MSISRTEIAVDSNHTLRGSRAAFDYIDTPIIATEASGSILAANRSALELTGFTHSELLSQPIDILLPSETVSAAHNAWRCALSGEDISFACSLRGKRGSLIPVSIHLHGVTHQDYAEGVVATLHDAVSHDAFRVPSTVMPETAAPVPSAYSERLLDYLMSALPGFVGISRLQDERLVRVNNHFLQAVGLQMSDVIGKTSAELGLWRDPKQREQVWRRLRAEGHIENIEMQFIHPRTGARDLRLTQQIMEFSGDAYVLTIGVDVTEQQSIERKLQDTAERFKRQYEHFPLPTYSWRKVDSSFVLIAYNEAAAAATMNRVAEYMGHDASEMYREYPIIVDHMHRCFDHKKNTKSEGWFRMATTGEQRYIVATYVYVAPDTVMVHVDDCTVAKQTESALRASEARARQMIEANPVGISFSNIDGQLFEANRALLGIVGYSREDLLGGCINELTLTAPPYVDSARNVLAALARGETPAPYQSEYMRKDGNCTPVLVGKSDVGGGMVVGFVVDLTELKHAERQIAMQAKLLNAVHQAVIAVDRAGLVTYWNHFAEILYRLPASAVTGRRLPTHILEHESNKIDTLVQSALRGEVRTDELECHRSDGSAFVGWVTATPLYVQSGEIGGAIVVCIDVSARRKLEDDAIKAQKLESIGVLAGGIAHDFNNVLTAILGNISLAKLHVENPNRAIEALTHAEKGFWRARELTNQLLTFAKGGAPICKLGLLNNILIDTCQFALSGASVGLRLNVALDLWPGNYDPGQIGQVINHLINNAKEAMPHGGTLTVDAQNVTLSSESTALPAGRYVQLSFSDTGVGIPPEHLAKVFDPYFSTKNSGSGLGLAMAYSIISRHGGHIAIESEVDRGTRVSVYLPAADAKTATREKNANVVVEKINADILVMDDDAMIRDVARLLLRGLGYRVETAIDGQQAIALYKKALAEGRSFAVVILDLTVPGAMGGLECLDALKVLDRNVRAIVSSGYSNDPIVAHYREHGFAGVVNKPYRLSDLQATLVAVLRGDH